ncbi:hypothetical protein [Bacillus sp. SG-1]|uniref:hypothetical protein n=1 Tax=Bacillus sp. SG-1 TaxID=161544 RepID=UPI0001545432|nr:hypothetical protein [Bacillus sp. SG-1]EDL62992.1 hypothetical protein BSG1_06037 [Bacillus sp. SG-1]
MEKAIKLLVWGLLFLLIDIRINTFDIFHDAIGYIFLFRGMKSLPHSKWVTYAKTSVIILAVLSLIEIIGFGNININDTNRDFTWEIAAIGGISILSLFFHMNLLSSMLVMAPDKEVLRSVGKFKRVYFSIQLIIILTFPAILLFRDWVTGYLLIIIVTGLIVEIIYIVKINSFKRYISSAEHTS